MFHRFFFLLLTPCMLIQSAPLGHCRAATSSDDPTHRPHFHTNSTARSEHSCSGSHHHTDEASAEPVESEPSDHDSDAVYLVRVDAVVERAQIDAELAAPLRWLLAETNPLDPLGECQRDRGSRCAHDPTDSGLRVPRYVRHLALLI